MQLGVRCYSSLFHLCLTHEGRERCNGAKREKRFEDREEEQRLVFFEIYRDIFFAPIKHVVA